MKKFFLTVFTVILIITFTFPLFACDYAPTKTGEENAVLPEEKPVTYYISDEFFSDEYYYFNAVYNGEGENGETNYKYNLTVCAVCAYSLFEYSADIMAYSSENEFLYSQVVDKTETVEKNKSFSFEIEVTKELRYSARRIELYFRGKSEEEPSFSVATCKITLVYNNGDGNFQVAVRKGQTMFTPSDPVKNNYIFIGWYDADLTNKYDFSKKVNYDTFLYAKYIIDAAAITNTISTDTIKGIVKVYNRNYNTTLGIETSYLLSQGSGFCFHIQNGYYYILTNCHVAKKKTDYANQKITIEDYQGNTYDVNIYKSPSKTVSAIASSYDLACLYFKPSSTNIKKLDIVSEDPLLKDDIISLGAPKGQTNTITYGIVNSYRSITLSDTPTYLSNVTFSVLCHDAYINNGSSGGPVLNTDLHVVGVNYAGNKDSSRAYAVSATKIKEFLNEYFYG